MTSRYWRQYINPKREQSIAIALHLVHKLSRHFKRHSPFSGKSPRRYEHMNVMIGLTGAFVALGMFVVGSFWVENAEYQLVLMSMLFVVLSLLVFRLTYLFGYRNSVSTNPNRDKANAGWLMFFSGILSVLDLYLIFFVNHALKLELILPRLFTLVLLFGINMLMLYFIHRSGRQGGFDYIGHNKSILRSIRTQNPIIKKAVQSTLARWT